MINLLDDLINHNSNVSAEFCSPEESSRRRSYRNRHRTMILALKCMDGRLNLSVTTNTPLGIIEPIRELGGQFNLGWPHLNDILIDWSKRVIEEGTRGVILVTYHFSKSEKHLGCAGFECNTTAAIKHTAENVALLKKILGESIFRVIQLGIETDEDSLIIHTGDGDVIKVADYTDVNILSEDCRRKLGNSTAINDFIPLIERNWQRVQEIRQENGARKMVIDHQESILCVGRGFDWLHKPNKALIVGTYQYNLNLPIIKAANILLDNITSKRNPHGQTLIVSSSPYYDQVGSEKLFRMEKAKRLLEFTMETIEKEVPELVPYIHSSVYGLTNMATRKFEINSNAA